MNKYHSLKLLVVFILISSLELFAQELKFGFRFEPFIYGGVTNFDRPNKDELDFFLTSIYLTSSFPIDDFFQGQLRLGYLGTKDYSYNGWEGMILVLLKYKSGIAPTLGLNLHRNRTYQMDDISYKNELVISPLVGFEGRFGDNFQCGILAQFPINSENSGALNYPPRFLIKMSVGWEFEL